ncbi:hypothetical protein TRIATDRAFT_301441 [Trichoderma atroviride IMI 206040]|uniref:BZIP domain-containing protein n=2 Tax=Hypocrea atroviridis TaxID=63577 RepID=G9P6I8_HYPAI|nr:uncharacterized protein TRIATDRAFT_301441 [Trichoderma atroviride IMI 206040]EHK40631.1 hypothetical protein TRIATDRAFT_301441 [Trichoderma atroviride IMI 206040]
MSSLSPDQIEGGASQASTEGTDKGVLSSLNLNFFKNLSDKKVTRTGNPPKRRGPKPDSKPALTRRQELNRQAQRTHRERKEIYIKALEDEVIRLKEVFSTMSLDKQKLYDENKQLKEVLAQRGIQLPKLSSVDDSGISATQAMSVSASGNSFAHGSQGGFSPTGMSQSTGMSMSPDNRQPSPAGNGVDHEQAGIDFVLTLEKPCMAHMPFLVDRASDADGAPCGHALMASCPPAPFQELTPDTPFGSKHTHDHGGEFEKQGTWELTKADLTTLLDLSKQLNLDGEITPVMAWRMVTSHYRFNELAPGDLEKLSEELLRKIRCYGFGAVMEEFELRDALENIFSGRPEAMVF